jgi:hypothetical protein
MAAAAVSDEHRPLNPRDCAKATFNGVFALPGNSSMLKGTLTLNTPVKIETAGAN